MSNEARLHDYAQQTDVGADDALNSSDAGWNDASSTDGTAQSVRTLPRISIQAFCENESTAEVIACLSDDRRMAKAHLAIHMGGVGAAVSEFQDNPTPNLIVIESTSDRAALLIELDQLAECCDAGTKVLVVGHVNDVVLYRTLLRRGVSDYVVAPVQPIQFMEAVSNLYTDPASDPVGRVIAFVGAKGGVGSSTICHNVAWTIAETLQTGVVITDFDLAFGTTGLDFNQDPVQGVADALAAPERLDDQLLDRLLTRCSDNLNIFAAPAVLERDYDISAEACETVINVVRQNVPYVVLDVPHGWTSWSKHILMLADEIVVTATPDLANIRNAKNVLDILKQNRTNDGPPHLVLNMVNMPKRPEINIAEFSKGVDCEASVVFDFDIEAFGNAANNGQMIEEINRRAKAVEGFRSLSLQLTQRGAPQGAKVPRRSALTPLLDRFRFSR